jgi:CO/xanthine dehydrogenase Mo-binding subunit
VRSPHAHARILRVDVDAARRQDGVIGVFTLADLPELRGALPPPVVPAVTVKPYRQSALADSVVRFAGEAVAVAVATDPYCAADAAEAVQVAYEPLAVVVDPERAVEAGAALVRYGFENRPMSRPMRDAMRDVHKSITFPRTLPVIAPTYTSPSSH